MSLIPVVDVHNRVIQKLNEHVTTAALRQFVQANRGGTRPPFELPRQLDQRVRSSTAIWRV